MFFGAVRLEFGCSYLTKTDKNDTIKTLKNYINKQTNNIIMKETKKSLKIYFVAVGVLSCLSTILGIFMATDVLVIIISIISLIIPVMFVYYGIKLYSYMQKSPKTLVNFIIISWGASAILYLMNGKIGVIIFSGLIAWYLVYNIKKLSTQTSIVDGK